MPAGSQLQLFRDCASDHVIFRAGHSGVMAEQKVSTFDILRAEDMPSISEMVVKSLGAQLHREMMKAAGIDPAEFVRRQAEERMKRVAEERLFGGPFTGGVVPEAGAPSSTPATLERGEAFLPSKWFKQVGVTPEPEPEPKNVSRENPNWGQF